MRLLVQTCQPQLPVLLYIVRHWADPHTHTCTHGCTHARTHARKHARTHAHTNTHHFISLTYPHPPPPLSHTLSWKAINSEVEVTGDEKMARIIKQYVDKYCTVETRTRAPIVYIIVDNINFVYILIKMSWYI